MINKMLIPLIVIGLFFVVGCTPEKILYDNMEAPQKIDDMEPPQKIDDLEPPKTTLHFTLANERSPDRNVKAILNGKTVFDGELKFGFGVSEKVDFETTEGTFSFEVTDLTNNKKETTTINTEKGLYVAISFWGDSITIKQSTEEQIRFD